MTTSRPPWASLISRQSIQVTPTTTNQLTSARKTVTATSAVVTSIRNAVAVTTTNCKKLRMCRKYNVHGRIEGEGTGGAHPLPQITLHSLSGRDLHAPIASDGPVGLGICKGTVNVLFSFEEEGSLGVGNTH